MYNAADDKAYIEKILENCDRIAFDEWVKKNSTLEDLSIRELRIIAHQKQIPYYSRMDKSTLIEELRNANAAKDSPTPGGHAPDNGASQDR
jgi:hypothetical protein